MGCSGIALPLRLCAPLVPSVVLAMAFVLVGCTTPQPYSSSSSTPPPPPRTSPVISSPSGSPASASPAPAMPANRTVELSCADATSSATPPTGTGGTSVDGVTFEGAGVRGASVRGLDPAAVGLRVPAGTPLYWRKVPVYLNPGGPATTVELRSEVYGHLAWLPARLWTGAGSQPIDLAPWMASRVVFRGCPQEPSTYLGGVLSTHPAMCLTLRVHRSTTGLPSREVSFGSSRDC